MATIRRMWVCKNKGCKNKKGVHRGYKKVCLGENRSVCKWCLEPMLLNKSHTARVLVDGVSHTHIVSPNKKDAEAFILDFKIAERTGNMLPGEEVSITWAKATERFESWLADPGANDNLSAASVSFYGKMLKPFEVPFRDKELGMIDFKKMTLQSIEKKHIDAFKTMRMQTKAAATVNGSLTILKRLYSVICSQERAANTPRLHEAMTDVFKVKLLKLDNAVETILENEAEMNVLLGFCGTTHLHHFVFGILNTGLRHSDMLKLRIEEVSFAKNEIKTVVKGETKVTIPLTAAYRAYLEKWITGQKVRSINGGYLMPSHGGKFPENKGKPFTTGDSIGFSAACEKAAVHYETLPGSGAERQANQAVADRFRALTPHCLRHTFATHFLYKASKRLGATAAVHVLSEILGHSSAFITERYSHSLKDVQQSAMAAFGVEMFSTNALNDFR